MAILWDQVGKSYRVKPRIQNGHKIMKNNAIITKFIMQLDISNSNTPIKYFEEKMS